MAQKTVVTLTVIAKATGFSTATVSRALRGNPALPKATITRIKSAAKKLGYRLNPLVTEVMRHLRGGQVTPRGTLAYLVLGKTRHEWREHLSFVGFYEGARARAEELGFTLEQLWANDPAMKPARLKQILLTRNITGLLVGPTLGLPIAPQLDWSEFSPVKIGVPYPDLPLPCAVSNHYQAMRLVISRLNSLGYQRLGLVLQEHQNIKTSALWLTP